MNQRTSNPIRSLFNPQFIVLMVVSFFISGSFYLVNTSLSAYAVSLGASLTLAGVIVGCFSITSLVVRPFSGVVVNHFSKKGVMLAACGFMLVASLAYILVPTPELLIAVRILHGIGFALNSTVSLVLVSYTIPNEQLGQGVAYFGLAQMLASAVMPAVGAWLAERWGGTAVFLVTAAIVVVGTAALASLRISEPPREVSGPEKRLHISLGEILCLSLLPLSILGGLFSMFNGINSSFMLQVGDQRGISNISLYFTVNTVAIVSIRLLLGRVTDKRSIFFVLIPATISAVLAAVLLGAAYTLLGIIVAAVFQAAGQGMAQPSLQAECIKRTAPERRGTASSTYFMCSDIGQGLGTMLGGAISDHFGYGTMYNSIAGIFVIAAVLCVIFGLQSRRKTV